MKPEFQERMGRLSELVRAVELDRVDIRESLDMHQFCAYWGAYDAFSYIKDCICLVHGTKGCMASRRFLPVFGSTEPCEFDPHLSTGFTEQDVIFGGETKLEQSLKKLQSENAPSLIAVITNCCADIIGDDVGGIVESVRRDGQEMLWLHTGGFTGKSYRKGTEEAFRSLAELMERFPGEKDVIPGTVNLFVRRWIWGETQEKEIAEGVRLLGKLGLKVNQVMQKGLPLEDFVSMRRAEANVAQCFYFGSALFEEMENRFGTKRIKASTPYGLTATRGWMEEVAAAMNVAYDAEADDEYCRLRDLRDTVRARLGQDRHALIWTQTGERMIGMTKLAMDMGLKPIVIGVDPAVVRDKVKMFRKEVNEGFDPPIFISTYVEDVRALADELGNPVIFSNEDHYPGHTVFRYRLANNQAYGLAGARQLYEQMLTVLDAQPSRFSFLREVV